MHVHNIGHIFHTIVPHTYITQCTECYTNLEYDCVVLTALMQGDLRLVTRSTINKTKRDTTTTMLLATILLPCTETVLDVQKIPSVPYYNTQCALL